MKKPKLRKTRKQATERVEVPSTLTPTVPMPAQSTKELALRTKAWQLWKELWAFIGPLIAVTSFAFLMMPQVSIEPSVNLDPAQPLATQFLITNRGRVPVYNVRFGCSLSGKMVQVGHMSTSSSTIAPVAVIPAGKSVTKGCALASQDIQAEDIAISVTYHWPIIRIEATEMGHFAIRHSAPGFFLVPNLQQ
jgi:hypothetical protein